MISTRVAMLGALLAATPAWALTSTFTTYFGRASGAAQVVSYRSDLRAAPAVVDPYPGFNGGVRVATGDVNGDGVADLVTGAGPGGGPHVKVFDGAGGGEIRSFFAFDAGFTGGVNVATGDLDGDGRAEVIVGAGAGGGPQVRAFDGDGSGVVRDFLAFDSGFGGGVSVTAGDFGGDGHTDIIVGAGAGGGPHVKVFDGLTGEVRASFFAFDAGFTGGVSLATGRYLGSDALFVGAGPGGAPRINIYSLSDLSLLSSFLAFDPAFDGGVNVGAGRIGGFDIVLAGTASRVSKIDAFTIKQTTRGRGASIDQLFELTPFGAGDTGGLFVAGVAAVPEPAVWLQLLAGFGIAGMVLRRARAGAPA